MIDSCPSILCKLCFDLLYVTHDCYVPTDTYNHASRTSELPKAESNHDAYDICNCGNVAIIVDEDSTFHIYVDDIRTTQRAIMYHNDFIEVRRELLKPFGDAVYSDYNISNTPINFEIYKPYKYQRKTATQYDKKLIHMLQRHKYTTSDGKENNKRKAT